MSESFPRQKAATRSFRLGSPKHFRISPRADLVLFIRSAGGRNPVGDIWCARKLDGPQLDGTWREEIVFDTQTQQVGGELPPEEKARRERMREVTEGVTSFTVDENFTTVAFVLDGELFAQRIPQGEQSAWLSAQQLDTGGGCIDPQLSPDGHNIAFVKDSSLWVISAHKQGDHPRKLAGPAENETDVMWGLADFAAAEELNRVHGFWWLPDSAGVLVERVDESGVETAWIADPANPRSSPRAHKYPFAGTTNAEIALYVCTLDSSCTKINWDSHAFPYLATVRMHGSAPTLSFLSRNQQEISIHTLEGTALHPVETRTEVPWHSVSTGVPTIISNQQLVEIRPIKGSYRLCVDGEPVTPVGMEVNGVVSTTDEIVFTASANSDPTHQLVYSLAIGSSGIALLSTENGVHSAVMTSNLMVLASTDLESVLSSYHLIDLDDLTHVLHEFVNNSETPTISPRVEIVATGVHGLRSAVLWPENHIAGTKLPVICAPYGGPQHQRVIAAGMAYLSDQWLANQGFAVVITDNRGTPSHGTEFEYAIAGDLATVVVEDQVQALTDLAKIYPDLDLDRVGIHGWSFGGYLAALAVMERPDVFHAAVAGAPVTDWALYDTAYTERYLGTPQDNSEQYERSSLLTKANKLTRPLLIIHGLADDNVLIAHTLQLSGALLAAGKNHCMLPLTGVTHMTPQEIVAENLMLAELEFFQQNL
jgi:dipeptidyl-peptidase-4